MPKFVVENKLLKIVQKFDNSIKSVILTKPKNSKFGDLSTNIALILSSKLKKNPNDIAISISKELNKLDNVKKTQVAGGGFIIIFLSHKVIFLPIIEMLNQKERYGYSNDLKNKKINLEYVSANPTGPLHIAGARWASVGSSLSQILKTQGANVTNEYYINDAGVQIDAFINTLYAIYTKTEMPENAYKGEYLNDIIDKLKNKLSKYKNYKSVFRKYGVEEMLKNIKQSLKNFRTEYNVFFYENDLYKNGDIKETISKLKQYTYKKNDALWLKTTLKGDSKDRVLIKSDSNYAYFSSDIAYIKNKIDRGFNELIYILGADHHGYVQRLK